MFVMLKNIRTFLDNIIIHKETNILKKYAEYTCSTATHITLISTASVPVNHYLVRIKWPHSLEAALIAWDTGHRKFQVDLNRAQPFWKPLAVSFNIYLILSLKVLGIGYCKFTTAVCIFTLFNLLLKTRT